MSVLIKGMEMPKDCPMCPMSHWNAVGSFTGCDVVSGKRYAMGDEEYRNSSTRPEWCPLVPVPPHGRLIEAEPIMKFITDGLNSGEFGYDQINVLTEIQYAPTILEAEGNLQSDSVNANNSEVIANKGEE